MSTTNLILSFVDCIVFVNASLHELHLEGRYARFGVLCFEK